MRRLLSLLSLLLIPLLSACYQVDGDVVPASASVRVDGIKDGRWRRTDGVEVTVRWNEAEKLYDVKADGAERAGTARASRIASGIYLLQYMDVTRIAVLARVEGDDMVVFGPTRNAEKRLLHAHGLTLRPGPIEALNGSPAGIRNFFKDLAASGDFGEERRVVFLR